MTRETAIKGLKAFRKEFSGYEPNEEMFDMAIKALEQEPRWIPINEKLPETGTEVLAATTWGEVTIADRIGKSKWFIHDGHANAYTEDLTAWMPLPKAYREVEE